MESGLKTDDGEQLSRADLIARIIDPVSFEKVRQGGQLDDAEWRCNRARDKAAHIATLFDTRAPSDAALVEALEAVINVMGLDHARTCAGRVCDCDVEDTRDHVRRSARAALAAAKGQQP